MILCFWCWLIRVVLDREPLSGLFVVLFMLKVKVIKSAECDVA